MKTSVDAVSGVERKITVEIPAEEVDRRIEQQFTELRRMVPVRGFRKGKAPVEMVKRMFRDSVEAEVSELEAMRATADSLPRACVHCPSRAALEADRVVLSRAELVRLVVDAIERFGGA